MRDTRARYLVPGDILAGSGFEVDRVVLTHKLVARKTKPVVMVRGKYPTGATKVYEWNPDTTVRVLEKSDLDSQDEN